MPPQKTRILVVDDDRLVVATLVSILSRAGFDVVVASSAYEATRLAVETKPALALLDVLMEGRNGLAVAEFLTHVTRLPFMFLSADSDEGVEKDAASLGALGSIAKPIDAKQVVPAVLAALERSSDISHRPDDAAMLAETLAQGGGQHSLVAIGILVERHKVNCDRALEMLHENARLAGLPVDEVALQVIEQAERSAATRSRV